jgi:non-homologous end joining protein Ku
VPREVQLHARNLEGQYQLRSRQYPIALYPATRKEDLKFRLLRASDHSPVNYKRVAETDGKEVPWDRS